MTRRTHVFVVGDTNETLVSYRRSHAVEPQLLVLRLRSDESRRSDLLGVQSELDLLRRVLTDRENFGDGFGRERVPESDLCSDNPL